MKPRSLTRILTLLFILPLPVQALGGWQYVENDVRVEIITDQRGRIEQFDAGSGGADSKRRYVIARHGERYRIRVTNPTDRQIGLVIAVDGRNIISGRKSHLARHERMYILTPHESQEFDGWRTGTNHINRFYFTDMSNSYAAHWGDESAMGVVAVAAFKEEKPRTRKRKGVKDHPPGNSGGRVFGKFRSQREAPGTGFGEGEWSPSREVSFTARPNPMQKVFIKYEYRKTLCRMGVIECRPRHPKHAKRHNRFWPYDGDQRRNGDFAPNPFWFWPPKF